MILRPAYALIFILAGAAAALLLAGLRAYLLGLGLPQVQAGVQALALTLYLELLLLCPFALCAESRRGGVLTFLAAWAGAALAGVFSVSFIDFLAGHFIAGAFSLLLLLAGLAVQPLHRYAAQALCGTLLILFMTSAFWSAGLTSLGAGESGAYLAVWLSPQAVVASGLSDFSFAHLPLIYRVWLGPVAPLPQNWLTAGLYYLLPALPLALLPLLRRASPSTQKSRA